MEERFRLVGKQKHGATMKEITADSKLVAFCGLYCGACKAYLKEKCPGCLHNEKASWCKVRSCCTGRAVSTCAVCTDYPNPRDCSKYNNLIARLFGLIFRSDRGACIKQIREIGLDGHAARMAELRIQTIKK
jgi:hypothetical protein